MTTNRDTQDLYPLFPNQVLAEGLLDRLLNSAYVLTLLGRSYRRRQRPAAPAAETPRTSVTARDAFVSPQPRNGAGDEDEDGTARGRDT